MVGVFCFGCAIISVGASIVHKMYDHTHYVSAYHEPVVALRFMKVDDPWAHIQNMITTANMENGAFIDGQPYKFQN